MVKNEMSVRLYRRFMAHEPNVFGVPDDEFKRQQTVLNEYLLTFIKEQCPYMLCIGADVSV